MIDFEDIKLFLPKYLSVNSEQNLFENLKDFPKNMDSGMYSNGLLDNEIIYQGDGLEALLLINLPDNTIREGKVVILSNTCDIDLNNPRIYPTSVCYSPIINLEKYVQRLEFRKVASKEKIRQFIESIKEQKITQIFYLPKGGKLTSESFIFFDKINSCSNESISRNVLDKTRLFTLSNYGFYLFLFKFSVHFSRVREHVDRG